MSQKAFLYLVFFMSLTSYAMSLTSYAVDFEIKTTAVLKNNISYSTYISPTFPLVAYVVKIPNESCHLKLIPAIGQREEVSSIATRSNAYIAINGSNYRRGGKYNGNRVNLFCINNKIITDPGLMRGALIGNNSKNVAINTLCVNAALYINNKSFMIHQINQPRAAGKSNIYTDRADVALLAHNPGTNVIINAEGKVVEITKKPIAMIEPNSYVYQTDSDQVQEIKDGMQCLFSLELTSFDMTQKYEEYDFILGGAGLLIKNGQIVSHDLYKELGNGKEIVHCGDEIAADFHTKEMQQWLIELRHPRTAIGLTQKNEYCLVVVDGRQTDSQGLTLHELASFMEQLGCYDALNIGGGGCTTLFIDGEIINNPSAGQERPVSEALCFCL